MENALLRFGRTRDPLAFEALVDRYVHVVYAAARRQLADESQAQDATQAVFILLSQKAGRLARRSPLLDLSSAEGEGHLMGWLLRATHFVCRDVLKREVRRRFHESRAAMLHARQRDLSGASADAPSDADVWKSLMPVLDAALISLKTTDRAAVALRYLENRPLKEVGAALGISQEAARKRVDRALGRLRRIFARRGVVVPAAVGGILAAHAPQAAPAAVVTAALSPPTAAATALAAGGARLLAALQMKLAAATAAVLLVVGAVSVVAIQSASRAGPPAALPPRPAGAAAMVPVAATPPAPATAATMPEVARQVTYHGLLLDPAGKAVAHAAIRVYLGDRPMIQQEWQGATAADGSFHIGPLTALPDSPNRVVVFDAPSAGLTAWRPSWQGPFDDFLAVQVTLRRPTQVAGTITDSRGQPIANATVEASVLQTSNGTFELSESNGMAVRSDVQGKFHFDRIPEHSRLKLSVHHPDHQTWTTDSITSDYVVAADTSDVDIQLRDAPATLRVQLTRSGKPLAQAGVWIQAIEPTQRRGEARPSDAAGTVEFSGLSPGAWRLAAAWTQTPSMIAFVPQENIALQGGQRRDVTMEAGGITVRGIETDADTHLPMRRGVGLFISEQMPSLAEAKPDAAGRFEFHVMPGKYKLMCATWENGRQDTLMQDLTVPAGAGDMEISLKPHDWPAIHGRLVDTEGRPLAGIVALDDGTSSPCVAGADGRFTMAFPSSHDGFVVAAAIDSTRKLGRGFLVSRANVGREELRIVLEPLGTIVGRAVDSAVNPLPDTKIEPLVHISEGSMAQPTAWIWKIAMQPDGSFRVTSMPVGYRLDFYLQNQDRFAVVAINDLQAGAIRLVGDMVLHGPSNGTYPARPLRPNPGRPMPLREPWDASITGRILSAAGKPVAGVRLSAFIQDNAGDAQFDDVTVSDLKGRFTIAGLPHQRHVHLNCDLEGLHDIPAGAGEMRSWDIVPSSDPIELRLTPAATKPATDALP